MAEHDENLKILVFVIAIGILVVVLLTRGCETEEPPAGNEPAPMLFR